MVKPKKQVHFLIQTIQKVPLQQHLLLKLLICICELKVFKFFGILPYISVHDRCHYNHANYSNRCNHANGKWTVVVSGHIIFRMVCLRSGFAFSRLLYAILGMLLLVLCALRGSFFLCALDTLVLLRFPGFSLLIFFRFLVIGFLDPSLLLVFLGFALLSLLIFISSFACSWRQRPCS